MSLVIFNAAEARVIAALVEKSLTTPQYYPMSTNAIMLAANQKTCRAPVTNLSEGETGASLNRLEELKFVSRDAFSARAVKWRHAFHHQMLLDSAQTAVLVTLMLRGTQTLAELRVNAGPLKGPADESGVSAALKDLMERSTPLVVQLSRAAGQAATRYAHTLCGAPSVEATAVIEVPARAGDRVGVLEARIEALEARLAELEQRFNPASP